MTDHIKSILEGVKDRVSNPLIFAFLISWVFFNWPVVVALLWYDPPEGETHYDLIGYINKKVLDWHSWLWPLCFGIGYVILAPVAKQLVRFIEGAVWKYGNRAYFKFIGGAYAPMDQIISREIEIEKKEKALSDLTTRYKTQEEMNGQLRNKITELEAVTLEQKSKIHIISSHLDKISDGSVLNGYFDLLIEGESQVEVTISDGKIRQVTSAGNFPLFLIFGFASNAANDSFNFALMNGQSPQTLNSFVQIAIHRDGFNGVIHLPEQKPKSIQFIRTGFL